MDPDILAFIQEQKVATVCGAEDNSPYCFNCYYSFIADSGLLVYKSSLGTRHEEILKKNPVVAGTIIPEQIEVAVIRGVQFQGAILPDSFDLNMKASASYYLKFPFALAVPGKLYVVELQDVKFTDNTKGFGFKQHWSRQR